MTRSGRSGQRLRVSARSIPLLLPSQTRSRMRPGCASRICRSRPIASSASWPNSRERNGAHDRQRAARCRQGRRPRRGHHCDTDAGASGEHGCVRSLAVGDQRHGRAVSRLHQADRDAAEPSRTGGLGHPPAVYQHRDGRRLGQFGTEAQTHSRRGAHAGRPRDVNIVNDGDAGVLPSPASVVISTRIKPGHELAYRAWEQRIAAAQSKATGFQGYRFEPPVPGVQDDWLAILRFDTEANLQAWLDSPERQKLLKDANPFTEEFHARIVRTGFDQWFPVPAAGTPPPAAWKMNMLVLLMLYPVVFLFGFFVQTPFLIGRGLPFAIALFIGNIVSVVLLSYLVPWMAERFSWWLQPAGPHPRRLEVAGAALVVALYTAMLLAFWRLF